MDMDKVKKTFSERLKMARVGQKLSQKKFAELLGVSVQSIQNWESERLRDLPNMGTVMNIAEILKVPVTFLMGDKIKDIPTPPQETKEQPKKIEYDFYKYINKEYDLKEHPELIKQHFEYMTANPEICKEIPRKYGKWNIGKVLKEVRIINTLCRPSFPMAILKLKELDGTRYEFEIYVKWTSTWDMNYQKVGELLIDIDFDENIPTYCGVVEFLLSKKAIKGYCENRFNHELERQTFLSENIMPLVCRVLFENGIDDTFLIADKKDNKIVERESITRKIHYFVIEKHDHNELFWEFPQDEIINMGEQWGVAVDCKFE